MSPLQAFIAGCIAVSVAVAVTETVASSKAARFDEITVGRINIVEPDGTKRIIISNRSQFPGDFYRGKETQRPDRRDSAGLLFINDEGTENGGLIQSGVQDKDGKVNAGLSLTFDRFRQDQALQLSHEDDGSQSVSAVRINDVPDPNFSSYDDIHRYVNETAKMTSDEKRAYVQKLKDEGKLLQNRIYMGTTEDHAAALVLKDAKGKPRLRLAVTDGGEAVVELLDGQGKVLKKVSAAGLE